ncbi:MAG: hypothetical protein EA376_09595 [Phycisphaeraceae bacterium]|nr:MAG: hypothetical protein EA376_09595 [Phycisphaeraceae bacterium]
MPERIDLDEQIESSRRPLDATWSPKKKKIVACVCISAASLALFGGVFAAYATRTPPLPTTIDQAVAVMSSSAFDRLDPERRRQYAAEAQRLMSDLSWEERRELVSNEQAREAMRAMREEMFDDMARRIARGEQPDFSQWGPRPGAGERRPPEGERRWNPQEMSDEDREAMRERMREAMDNRMNEQVSSGNAQSGGLRSEMMKRGMRNRGAGGGRRGR